MCTCTFIHVLPTTYTTVCRLYLVERNDFVNTLCDTWLPQLRHLQLCPPRFQCWYNFACLFFCPFPPDVLLLTCPSPVQLLQHCKTICRNTMAFWVQPPKLCLVQTNYPCRRHNTVFQHHHWCPLKLHPLFLRHGYCCWVISRDLICRTIRVPCLFLLRQLNKWRKWLTMVVQCCRTSQAHFHEDQVRTVFFLMALPWANQRVVWGDIVRELLGKWVCVCTGSIVSKKLLAN